MSLLSLVKSLAYISLPVFLLRTASNASPLARYYVRLGLYLSSIGVSSLWGLVAAVGMNLIGKCYDVGWIVGRSYYNGAGRVLDIVVEIEGEEQLSAQPSIIIMNHQSMLDVHVLARVFPKKAAITSKKELQWVPLLGQWMMLSGAVFIDRSNNSRAVKSVTAAGQVMREHGISLFVFPEGTRTLSENSDMLPFKKGAFHLAIQAGVPITPVVCQNYWRLYHKGTFESGRIKVKVLPPIPTTGLTVSDVGELALRARSQMLKTLHEISGDTVAVAPSASESKPSAEAPVRIDEAIGANPPEVSSPSFEKESTPVPTPAPQALAVDTSASQQSRRNGSDRGPETESDDGMVLVDRPETPADATHSS